MTRVMMSNPGLYKFVLSILLWNVGVVSATGACAAEVNPVLGTWRVIDAIPAPWAKDTKVPPREGPERTVIFEKDRIRAPSVMGCGKVAYSLVRLPAEGLFQGGLPAPAQDSARALGITEFPVPSVQISCDKGLFDYHFVDDATLLIALDNVVWTLSSNPGAPRALVSALLKQHFQRDKAFTPKSAALKRRWLSNGLNAAIQSYFAVSRPADEVPPINGDPFTDTQEYPKSFIVGHPVIEGGQAQVVVRFPMKPVSRQLKWTLVKGAQGWRVDDIAYPSGDTLRGLLQGGR